MTKPPIPTENSKTKGQHTHATKNFDYTTFAADLGRSVGVTSRPTSVVAYVDKSVRALYEYGLMIFYTSN